MRRLVRSLSSFQLDHSYQLLAAIVIGSLLGGGLMALHQQPSADVVAVSVLDRVQLKALIEEVTSGEHSDGR